MAGNEVNSNERNEAAQDEMLAAILQKLGTASGGTASGGASAQNHSASVESGTGASSGGSGDILSSLLSNPELISKLPTIIASIKPIIEMLGRTNSSTSASVSESTPAVSLPVQSAPMGSTAHRSGYDHDSRTALLCAMKPYLSNDRRNAIDYIVKLGRLGDILKTL